MEHMDGRPWSPREDQALALARWKDQKQGSRTSDKTWKATIVIQGDLWWFNDDLMLI